MARVIITLTDKKNGFAVDCHIETDTGDSELVDRITKTVAAGLAGHVSAKVLNALKQPRKQETKNVH